MFKKLLNRSSSSSSHSRSPSSASSNHVNSFSKSNSKSGVNALFSPPSYDEAAAATPSSSRQSGSASVARPATVLMEGGEDPFDFLRSYDTVFLIDDSGSMAGRRWQEARDALASVVATAAKYDDDGVDVHFLNSRVVGNGLKSSREVMTLFNTIRPGGGTPTGTRLEIILREHITTLERAQKTGSKLPKPLNIVVLTDGEPTDDPRSVIIAAAKRLDRGDFPLSAVGIFFLQIGNDPAATEALAELDDDLGADLRDIVDTAPYKASNSAEPRWVEKVLMGGVNRRIDRKSVR